MATEALNELCPLCLCPRHGRDFLRIAASGEWKHRAPYDCIYAMGEEIARLRAREGSTFGDIVDGMT